MKVNIGPYRDWFGPYQIAEKVFFWVRDRHEYDPLETEPTGWDYRAREAFGDWLADREYLCRFLSWIESKKHRKVDICIDPYDTWSMDHTLALIIHPMLVQLKQTNHGYFSTDPEDAPGIGVKTDENMQDLYDSAYSLDRYNFVMDEMIWAFEQIKDDEAEYTQFYKDGVWDMEGRKKYDERIQNGLRLFGKYFRGLWD